MSFSLGADEFILESKTRTILFSTLCYGCAPVCTETFIVNLPTAALNEGEEAGSLRSPVKGCAARFINSLHRKEHLQMRQTPPAPQVSLLFIAVQLD